MKRARRSSRRQRGLRAVLTRQPWAGPLLALGLVVNAGALGYRLTEGWDWGDCYWMVAITIPTIGYGEPEPLSHAGRVVTVFSIIGGLVVMWSGPFFASQIIEAMAGVSRAIVLPAP